MIRPVMLVLSFLAVLALGFWAYRENYATQHALREVEALNREIAHLRETLSVQRAEWAYLNRPDRLRELATINFERLGLLPLDAAQFGSAAEVAMPPAQSFVFDGLTDTAGLPSTADEEGYP